VGTFLELLQEARVSHHEKGKDKTATKKAAPAKTTKKK
jgi:hypothetical protein